MAVPAAAAQAAHIPADPTRPGLELPLSGAGAGTVLAQLEISATQGGLPDTLDDGDYFGSAVAALGDLDGDGVEDLAVGAPTYSSVGAAWILFLNPDGTVKAYRKISADDGIFGASTAAEDGFGSALAALGDLDGDGVLDLAVGAPQDDDGASGAGTENRGAVWVLFLRADGSPKGVQKISALAGGFGGTLDPHDHFGAALAALGDLDGDGKRELAVGAPLDDDGGTGDNERGAAWVLSLSPDGTVAAARKISATQGGFTGVLDRGVAFGWALAAPGDVDDDGTRDLVVGAPFDGDGSVAGAAWVLFLRPDASVRAQQKISAVHGGFLGTLPARAQFGGGLAAPGDLDGDGALDLVVGAPSTFAAPSAWALFLAPDGSVRSQREITPAEVGITGTVQFGHALAALGDLDGDGTVDLAAGEPYHTHSQGSTWTVFLAPDASVRGSRPIDGEQPAFPSTLDFDDRFGGAIASLGDLDGDGVAEIAVGASGDDEDGNAAGAVYVLFPRPDGTVRSARKICARRDGFPALPGRVDLFGAALAVLGDLDGDGLPELAVGAPSAPGEDSHPGCVWVLFLRADGSVRARQRIGASEDGLSGDDFLGTALAVLGDLDGDGVTELAVGAGGYYDEFGSFYVLFLAHDGTVKSERRVTPVDAGLSPLPPPYFGAPLAALGDLDGDGVTELAVGSGNYDELYSTLSVLFLSRDGSVRKRQDIGAGKGGFTGVLEPGDSFPFALAALGDLDGDGVGDVAVGAIGDDDGGSSSIAENGALWILFLERDGTVKAQQKISATQGGFEGVLARGDGFGSGLANLGDRDGDGLVELAVGAMGTDDGSPNSGALYLLRLDGVATLDFERADDLARRPLASGEALPGTAFTRTVALASSGENLGPALFDSTPARGASAADRDLRVGLGNVLVLQDPGRSTQSVPGIFDHPGDAPHGGLLKLGFRAPVEPRSLALVDIDSEVGQGALVTLVDVNGRVRVYDVPAGWTGDRVADHTSGFGTLDLTTLAPQAGFAASATAAQHARFDPRRVVELRVSFARSGALDAVRWDPYPALDGAFAHTLQSR